MNRVSHADVVQMGLEAGLSYEVAEDIAYEVCPEYRTAPRSKAQRAIVRAGGRPEVTK